MVFPISNSVADVLFAIEASCSPWNRKRNMNVICYQLPTLFTWMNVKYAKSENISCKILMLALSFIKSWLRTFRSFRTCWVCCASIEIWMRHKGQKRCYRTATIIVPLGTYWNCPFRECLRFRRQSFSFQLKKKLVGLSVDHFHSDQIKPSWRRREISILNFSRCLIIQWKYRSIAVQNRLLSISIRNIRIRG